LISDKYNQDDHNVFIVAGILLICGKLWAWLYNFYWAFVASHSCTFCSLFTTSTLLLSA